MEPGGAGQEGDGGWWFLPNWPENKKGKKKKSRWRQGVLLFFTFLLS